tara:strand:+ start:309 stop:515 length:207 start_codon:yes stop_codon:yes gene_type:complete
MNKEEFEKIVKHIKDKKSYCNWNSCCIEFGINEVIRESILEKLKATGDFKIVSHTISGGREVIRIKAL